MAENVNTQAQAEQSEFARHAKAAGEAMGKQWKSLIPDAFFEYGREARKETLLAIRALVDGAIDAVDSEGTTPAAGSARKAKVQVE